MPIEESDGLANTSLADAVEGADGGILTVDPKVEAEQIEALRVSDTETGVEREIPVGGLFVAIGHKPNTDLFKGVLDMEDTGYLVTRPASTYTNVEGVFACGDAMARSASIARSAR